MPRRAYATLRAEEVPLLLPHVPDRLARRLRVRAPRSYDRDKITGGHADALPIASPLLAFDAAMCSPGW